MAYAGLWLAPEGSAMPGEGVGESDLDLALEAWRAEHGASWELDVDPISGFCDFLYGGIAIPSERPGDEQGYFDTAAAFVIASSALHGIEPETPVLEKISFLPLALINSSNKTNVRFAQEVQGVRVEVGYLNVLLDSAEGYLLSVQSTALPNIRDFQVEPSIIAEEALVLAREQLVRDAGVAPDELTLPLLFITPPVQLGWTHGSSSATDDWQFADPTGFGTNKWADPLAANSGQYCAGNDLTGLDSVDGAYEPSADNWLLSPSFTVTPGTKTFLSFQRWLSVQEWFNVQDPNAPLDFAEIWLQLFQSDGSSSEVQFWRNHRSITHVDNKVNSSGATWLPFEIELTEALGSAATAKVKWVLKAENNSDTVFGGWAIDDVEIFKIKAP